ncbi:MAG TPA: DNA-deoxyinosine glycosylase [Mariprofundaceae bacterium]|nr:DNA-deoxyinosine glycosylase [Mariprofundaceae bacterium]
MAGASDIGFPYVAQPDARVLILGSMPGAASLAATQYYAHPRNAFWPLMGEMLRFDAGLPYAERLQALQEAGIALWDVVHRCHRPGSLDADIRHDTVEANDFPAFFRDHARIRAIFFNGQTAAALYRRHVLPQLSGPWRDLPRHVLPSTSPAHAGRSPAEKLAIWRQIADALRAGG